jgi:hypothetical protein
MTSVEEGLARSRRGLAASRTKNDIGKKSFVGRENLFIAIEEVADALG